MRAFVRSARESPGAWHLAPGGLWELRFPPSGRLFGEAEFGIRGAGSNAAPHRYRRAGRGAPPEPVREDARDYGGRSAAVWSKDEKAFALDVACVLDEWPDLRGTGGGLAAMVAELVRWSLSALESDELSRKQRFWIALAGSITFSVALAATALRGYSNLIQRFGEEAVSQVYPSGFGSLFLGALCVVLLFAFLFAFLCSWKSRVNGPLRIYAISFLFYYTVWRISYTVWSIASSVDVGVGAGSSP